MLRNKNAIECWNTLKFEIESIIDNFFPLKNKETFVKISYRKIVFKQTVWRVYRRTRKDEEYANYKEAPNAVTKLDNIKEAMNNVIIISSLPVPDAKFQKAKSDYL